MSAGRIHTREKLDFMGFSPISQGDNIFFTYPLDLPTPLWYNIAVFKHRKVFGPCVRA